MLDLMDSVLGDRERRKKGGLKKREAKQKIKEQEKI
jgi:hypothetical protein